MKKLISLAICLSLTAGCLPVNAAVIGEPELPDPVTAVAETAVADSPVTIDETNFPDASFRTYVSNHFDSDGDGTLSPSEAGEATFIVVSGTGVSTLRGIEYFPELSYLECQYNDLTTLDISQNTKLLDLRCDGNHLKVLDASANPNLQYLWCSENRLTSLDVSAGGLLMLNCEKNQLTALDVSANAALNTLYCGGNQLTGLNVGANRELSELYCQDNQIASLDVSALPALVYLNCDNNKLSALNVSSNPLLSVLECSGNNLTSIDVSRNTLMTYLRCASNKLTSIDTSANVNMIGLDCSGNAIKSLDLSRTRNDANPAQNRGPELSDLYCGGNPLGSLDVSQQTYLMYVDCSDAGLTSLDVSALHDLISLTCSSNSLSTLDLSHNKNMKQLICTDNIVRAPMTKSGNKWKFDLSKLLSSEEAGKITVSTKNAKRSGRTVTVTSTKMPASLTYQYKTGAPAEVEQLKVTVQPTAAKKICSHTGSYVTTKKATVFKAGTKKRTCPICGTVQTKTIKKLTPTIKLNASSLTLKVGQSTTALKVSGLANGDSVKSWKSSNTKLVKVTSKGKITATKKTGSTKVTVTLASGKKKSVTVKVQKSAVKTTSISGVAKTLSLYVGDTETLSPARKPITSEQKITYLSSNELVATVGADGTITAVAPGTAKITVTSGSAKATCSVTVK